MRRPAFHFSVFYVAGIYTAYLLGTGWRDWLAVILLLAVAAAVSPREKSCCLAVILIFAAGGMAFSHAAFQMDHVEKQAGLEVEAKGTVYSVSQTTEWAKLLVDSDAYGKVLVNIYQKNPDFELVVGKEATFAGLLELPQTAGNPGGFDYRMYLRSVGVPLVMQMDPDKITFSNQAVDPLANGIATFRHEFSSRLMEQIGVEQTGLIMAMLFGEKSGLGDETYEMFQRNGTAHILSVSGLHVGFLYSIFVFLIGGKRKPAANVAILAMLVVYGVLSGFCPSVNRALLMIGLHMLSNVLCRRYDLLSSAGIAAVILLVQNPYALFHLGFQLSFFSVILMGWIFPFIARMLPKGHILSVLLPIPLLQTAMAPYTAFLFNYFSFGAYAANFGVVFFSSLLVPAGLLAMLASVLPGPSFELVSVFLDLCARMVLWFNDATYADGRTCMDVVSPQVFTIMVFYGLFFFILSETGRILFIRKRHHLVGLALLLIVATGCYVDLRTEDGFDRADAVFVDVGQGDCLHIRTPSGRNILIDGGGKESFDMGKKVLKPYLLKNGVNKIDLAMATHLDMDHFDGLRGLAACGMVDLLGVYDGNRLLQPEILQNTNLEPSQIRYFHQGDKIKVDDWVWLEVLYPKQKSAQLNRAEIKSGDENPRSLVIRVHLGEYRILMTGDIDTAIEEELLSDNQIGGVESEILKIGHHGSKFSTSDEFLLATNPLIAVFQTGKNNYGHPDPTILEKCMEKGIMVYRTDRSGAIGFFGLYEERTPTVRTIKEGR
jgi:competence protein ComEC